MKKTILLFPLISVASFAFGILIDRKINTKRTNYIGTIRIDRSEEDEPDKIFLELETDLETLAQTKTGNVRIIRKNYVSHKNNLYNER